MTEIKKKNVRLRRTRIFAFEIYRPLSASILSAVNVEGKSYALKYVHANDLYLVQEK